MEWKSVVGSASDALSDADRLSPRDKMGTSSDSSINQMVFHGVPSNVHSFPVSYLDHWKGKFVWFHDNIHSTNSTKLHWTEKHPVVKELNSELTFFWSYGQRMVVVSGNTGSAPLLGSKAIRDRASSVKRTLAYVRVRPVLRLVRGGPDARWEWKSTLRLLRLVGAELCEELILALGAQYH